MSKIGTLPKANELASDDVRNQLRVMRHSRFFPRLTSAPAIRLGPVIGIFAGLAAWIAQRLAARPDRAPSSQALPLDLGSLPCCLSCAAVPMKTDRVN